MHLRWRKNALLLLVALAGGGIDQSSLGKDHLLVRRKIPNVMQGALRRRGLICGRRSRKAEGRRGGRGLNLGFTTELGPGRQVLTALSQRVRRHGRSREGIPTLRRRGLICGRRSREVEGSCRGGRGVGGSEGNRSIGLGLVPAAYCAGVGSILASGTIMTRRGIEMTLALGHAIAVTALSEIGGVGTALELGEGSTVRVQTGSTDGGGDCGTVMDRAADTRTSGVVGVGIGWSRGRGRGLVGRKIASVMCACS